MVIENNENNLPLPIPSDMAMLVLFRSMKFCPMCGIRMRVSVADESRDFDVRVCVVHGLGSVSLDEDNESVFVFKPFI